MSKPQRAVDDPRLAQVAFAVEATDFERNTLWERYSKEGLPFNPSRPEARVSWDEGREGGWLATTGELAGMPVTISLSFATVAGKLVLFYHAASQVVDHRMVEAWLTAHVPAYARGCRSRSDATNFYPGRMDE